MPLDPPQTSTSETTWIVNGRLSANSITSFQVSITVEGPGTESEGDQMLQDFVDLLSSRYYNVSGFKGYSAYTTRTMTTS
ncbi:hypothetical protein GTY41_03835 [Streptomyces sp. SID685]|uniref:hypothetical protein n=1 Tax=Streptomyces sp. SID685 TaxID=2690322 RepID=UPI00136AD49C|nr:hypothetical protein [Streptomyces sp. SID685]MYR84096.1 hypothetical protein [Streptomyces sp. SID685]